MITTDPVAGTPLRRDTAINVVVSKGKRPIKIPDWTGRSGDKAVDALAGLGFDVQRTDDFSDTVPLGRVISQSPSSGTGFKGDQVSLVVSKGPQLVTVPRLTGQKVEDATHALEGLGLNVQVVRSNLYIGVDRVVSTDPGEGAAVPRGTTVTLVVV